MRQHQVTFIGGASDLNVSLRDLGQFANDERSSFPAPSFQVRPGPDHPYAPVGDPRREAVLVNGVLPKPAYLIEGVEAFARKVRSDFTVIVNREEPGLFNAKENSLIRAVLNVVRGLYSTQQGFLAESEAVSTLKATIERICASGKTVDIFAHSQGALITSTALCVLARDAKWWSEHAGQIRVKALGGAGFRWPHGVRVKLFEHEEDPIPKITRLAHRILDGSRACLARLGIVRKSEDDRSFQQPDAFRIRLKSRHGVLPSHDMRAYLKNLPAFWAHQGESGGGLHGVQSQTIAPLSRGERAAQQLSHSRYGERYFSRLVTTAYKGSNRAFLQDLITNAVAPDARYEKVLTLARDYLNRLGPADA